MDGKTNANLQTVYLKGFPIHTAHFIENGEQVILASQRRHFYCYDMVAGNVTRIPEIRGMYILKHFMISVGVNLLRLDFSFVALVIHKVGKKCFERQFSFGMYLIIFA